MRMRTLSLALAAALCAQPGFADGLTAKARQELAAKNGGVLDEPSYDAATAGRMFEVPSGPSALPPGQVASRIKDLAQLQSARDNQLVGYGLVIGLQGSGDSLRNSPFTEQSIRAMLENLGIATEGGRARAKNVAAVMVTATLPPFARQGARIDVARYECLANSAGKDEGDFAVDHLLVLAHQRYERICIRQPARNVGQAKRKSGTFEVIADAHRILTGAESEAGGKFKGERHAFWNALGLHQEVKKADC